MVASTSDSAQIAVIGDLHSAWDDQDVAYFNQSPYSLLLFTGDLGASSRKDGLRIAKSISQLERDALVMPGNNDVEQYGLLASELAYRAGMRSLMQEINSVTETELRPTESRARVCGYTRHVFSFGGERLTVLSGRPFSMGGPEVAFAQQLENDFGVPTLEASTARLLELVDGVRTRDVIFLSHNGPSGFGSEGHCPWGNDFRPEGGDWGDPDLADAIFRAKELDLRVRAVIGGHMHSPLRGGGPRTWQVERDGTLYINPARVPRIYFGEAGPVRHHVALRLTRDRITAEERLVRQ